MTHHRPPGMAPITVWSPFDAEDGAHTVLLQDAHRAIKDLRPEDSQYLRRIAVRAVVSYIDSIVQARRGLLLALIQRNPNASLSRSEVAVINEEVYQLSS